MRNKRFRERLLTGVVIVAAMPAAAFAQDEDQQGGIGEIIVTAQRTEESAQRAPVVIDTVTADELSGVTDVRELANAVPGLQFANAGNSVQTYIRGVGSFNAKSVQESAVAYSVDGVYLFTTSQISPAMFDLARVEVLKGPQGTLYGRNASGGAVNIITQGARIGSLEGYFEGSLGNYSLFDFTGVVNLPVSDTFAVRLAGHHVEHDGYLSDGTSDDDTTAGRVRALWEPSSLVSVKFAFDAARVRGVGPGSVVVPRVDADDPWIGALDPRSDTGPTTVSGFRPLGDPFNELDQWSSSVELDWDLGFATMTVLPAYRHERLKQLSYVPGYGISEDADIGQKSLEARLAHQGGGIRWVAGAYYLKATNDETFDIINPNPAAGRPAVNLLVNPLAVESWAVFGETTVDVTDSFRLIGGLRYTWENSTSGGYQNQVYPSPTATEEFLPGVEPGDFYVNEDVTADAVTWKVGAQYDIAEDSSVFATVSKGFKGGGSYVDIASVDPTYEPETIVAYVFGSRNRFFDDTLQLNLEAFYWDISDQQISFVGFNALGQPKFQTTNASDSKSVGFSIDTIWLPTPNDRLTFGVEYVDSEYSNFVRVQPAAPVGTLCPTTTLSAGPPARVAIDCSGFPMMRTPKWAGSASYRHVFDMADGGELTAGGDMTFASKRYTSIDFSPTTLDGGYAIFNAEIEYKAPQQRWSLALWGRNLTETAYYSGGIQSGAFNRPTINQPRTYGVRGRINF
ncbi:TonB-dependent receptor [Croceicoccus bisphenolivorans]|uniref:TonB-dependent receptor n=1 Tax=Croceicoccus bisphenolivorans TaxID=1783232 RepID=UPI0009ECD5CC|nr:TonB-dependent receptor [Croceicoccus bisphenolivorans]